MEDEIWELCPFCDEEVTLKNEFKAQICTNCNCSILPCSICENHKCTECPLEK